MGIQGLDRVNDYIAKIVSSADSYSESFTLSSDDTIYVDTKANATAKSVDWKWNIGPKNFYSQGKTFNFLKFNSSDITLSRDGKTTITFDVTIEITEDPDGVGELTVDINEHDGTNYTLRHTGIGTSSKSFTATNVKSITIDEGNYANEHRFKGSVDVKASKVPGIKSKSVSTQDIHL